MQNVVIEMLSKMRQGPQTKVTKKKKLPVIAGKSISFEEFKTMIKEPITTGTNSKPSTSGTSTTKATLLKVKKHRKRPAVTPYKPPLKYISKGSETPTMTTDYSVLNILNPLTIMHQPVWLLFMEYTLQTEPNNVRVLQLVINIGSALNQMTKDLPMNSQELLTTWLQSQTNNILYKTSFHLDDILTIHKLWITFKETKSYKNIIADQKTVSSLSSITTNPGRSTSISTICAPIENHIAPVVSLTGLNSKRILEESLLAIPSRSMIGYDSSFITWRGAEDLFTLKSAEPIGTHLIELKVYPRNAFSKVKDPRSVWKAACTRLRIWTHHDSPLMEAVQGAENLVLETLQRCSDVVKERTSKISSD